MRIENQATAAIYCCPRYFREMKLHICTRYSAIITRCRFRKTLRQEFSHTRTYTFTTNCIDKWQNCVHLSSFSIKILYPFGIRSDSLQFNRIAVNRRRIEKHKANEQMKEQQRLLLVAEILFNFSHCHNSLTFHEIIYTQIYLLRLQFLFVNP